MKRKSNCCLSFCRLSVMILFLLCHAVSYGQKSVSIGSQTWSMNLNVKNFKNGDPIPKAQTGEEWSKAAEDKTPAWCYLDNDPSTADKYGILYNWYAVNDPRGLAPEGWHIATNQEWETLIHSFPNGNAKKLKTAEGWTKGFSGTNETGFSGYPVGFRGVPNFHRRGQMTIYWTSDEDDSESALAAKLEYNYQHAVLGPQYKDMGLSVRCVKN